MNSIESTMNSYYEIQHQLFEINFKFSMNSMKSNINSVEFFEIVWYSSKFTMHSVELAMNSIYEIHNESYETQHEFFGIHNK